jgi:hypothetical protein
MSMSADDRASAGRLPSIQSAISRARLPKA